MSFFHSTIGVLQTLVIALGAGLVGARSTFWKERQSMCEWASPIEAMTKA